MVGEEKNMTFPIFPAYRLVSDRTREIGNKYPEKFYQKDVTVGRYKIKDAINHPSSTGTSVPRVPLKSEIYYGNPFFFVVVVVLIVFQTSSDDGKF